MGPNQSRLLRIRGAGEGAAPEEAEGRADGEPSAAASASAAAANSPEAARPSSSSRIFRMPATLVSISSSDSRGRSVDRPLGSPTRPVAPPSSATGACPAAANHDSATMPSRLPTCSDEAVGSKPQ